MLTWIYEQRGALACVEFTGNIFGYAFSVVRFPIHRPSSDPVLTMVYSGRIISVLS